MIPERRSGPGNVIVVEWDAGAFAAALPTLLDIYAAAMGYAPVAAAARAPLWRDHAGRSGFRCVIAVEGAPGGIVGGVPGQGGTDIYDGFRADTPSADPIVAFGYGYSGAPGQWWFGEVARGLGSATHPLLTDYFELTELHVRPDRQGRGVGELLLRALLGPAPGSRVLLSTPEGENRAWRLYRRYGFTDVLRNFLFTGDARPFAVLGRALPLDAAGR